LLLSDGQVAAAGAVCGSAGDAEREPACAAPRGYRSALPRGDGVCPSHSARLDVPDTQARAGGVGRVRAITLLFPQHTAQAEGFLSAWLRLFILVSCYKELWLGDKRPRDVH